MKLMVIGYARHGKDTVCNLLRDMYKLNFVSSSYFVAEIAVRPWLKNLGIEYPDFDTMYADRVNHRADWFNAIAYYNKDDPARLGRELFQQYDIYCGLRRIEEFTALKKENAFDAVFWVDRGLHCPEESPLSMTIQPWHADWVINNNGDMDHLVDQVKLAYKAAFETLHLAKNSGA